MQCAQGNSAAVRSTVAYYNLQLLTHVHYVVIMYVLNVKAKIMFTPKIGNLDIFKQEL